MRGSIAVVCATMLLMLDACGGAKGPANVPIKRPTSLGAASDKGTGDARCNVTGPEREASEYDTSGDQVPDVRKVYLAVGTGMDQRLVVICRETDLNSDGRKDVIRYYDDEGRSVREEADRNFDGKMDRATQFQNGEIVREDFDDNYDGKLDVKVYFEHGTPMRVERDIAGRSTPEQWHPDRWEYYENGRIVRMGTDLDGDSRVDRWDRDATFKRPEEDAAASAVEGAAAEATGGASDAKAKATPAAGGASDTKAKAKPATGGAGSGG